MAFAEARVAHRDLSGGPYIAQHPGDPNAVDGKVELFGRQTVTAARRDRHSRQRIDVRRECVVERASRCAEWQRAHGTKTRPCRFGLRPGQRATQQRVADAPFLQLVELDRLAIIEYARLASEE